MVLLLVDIFCNSHPASVAVTKVNDKATELTELQKRFQEHETNRNELTCIVEKEAELEKKH